MTGFWLSSRDHCDYFETLADYKENDDRGLRRIHAPSDDPIRETDKHDQSDRASRRSSQNIAMSSSRMRPESRNRVRPQIVTRKRAGKASRQGP